jgi:hypothetical protein
VSLPARYWRVLVREHDGGESEGTYEQRAGEPPPIPRVEIALGGRRVVVDDVSTVDPPPGRVRVIRVPSASGCRRPSTLLAFRRLIARLHVAWLLLPARGSMTLR